MEIKFWKDKSKKLINPDLFSGIAEDIAQQISRESNDRTNTPTQIRKFYDEVIKFDSIVKTKPEEFDIHIPYIRMLNAKATYAFGRESGGKPLVSAKFRDFISSSVKSVNDIDDFGVFANFFEAFMGFFKFEYEEHKRQMKQQRENYSRGGRR